MIRRPPRSTLSSSSAASDVYKRQEAQEDRVEAQEDRVEAQEDRVGPLSAAQANALLDALRQDRDAGRIKKVEYACKKEALRQRVHEAVGAAPELQTPEDQNPMSRVEAQRCLDEMRKDRRDGVITESEYKSLKQQLREAMGQLP
eukprot:TRINITY_DN3945_c0_g1_i2.p1 TRINITY_DN3945_c0_g1~~TRINITY_DN3945_c0_g1_i2.p1  ORF type:complete len:145 (-),score=40.51 TRINITY_DN3945_c0_g1_i2:31-465(-)